MGRYMRFVIQIDIGEVQDELSKLGPGGMPKLGWTDAAMLISSGRILFLTSALTLQATSTCSVVSILALNIRHAGLGLNVRKLTNILLLLASITSQLYQFLKKTWQEAALGQVQLGSLEGFHKNICPGGVFLL